MERKQLLSLVLVAVVLITGNSCSLTKGKGIAEAAVAKFHHQYNARQFQDIYRQADEGFKKASSESDLIALLEGLQAKLGTVKQASPSGWGINATPIGTMATLAYDVEFTEGKGTEQFVFRINGDTAFLYNYHVNSPLLITK